MTLSDAKVKKLINHNFVCGWRNIAEQTAYAGKSNRHPPTSAAMQVNNCSGSHNVQMFLMTPDARVLHCLPGYWSPKHFLHEVEFSLQLASLYNKKKLSSVARNEKYLDLHLTHAYSHDSHLQHDSKLQGFDRKHVEKNTKDFKRTKGYKTGLKTPDQVIHERMAERPFVPFEKFDIASYINLGLKKYKYDFGLKKKGDGKHCAKCGTSCGCSNCQCK